MSVALMMMEILWRLLTMGSTDCYAGVSGHPPRWDFARRKTYAGGGLTNDTQGKREGGCSYLIWVYKVLEF